MSSATTSEGYRAWARHVNPVLAEFLAMTGRDHRVRRASGNRLECEDGRVLKDWLAGFGALGLGHNPAGPRAALAAFMASEAPALLVESPAPEAGALAQFLCAQAGPQFATCHFSNSGSEAVEAAIKLAVAATGRHDILYCRGGYHGVTLGALALMHVGDFREPFERVLFRWHAVDFNGVDALRAALAARPFAAVVIEPVQVEAGVNAATPAFLSAARTACTETGALLILDEVQTGLGRCGNAFAFQAHDVVPDVLVLAKALGAGLVPIGATLAREGLFRAAYGSYARCEIDKTTYGGNALACTVALAAARELCAPELLAQARATGALLARLLAERIGTHPLVAGVRMHGLLGAVELRESAHPWFDWAAYGLEEFAARPNLGPLLVHRLYRRGFVTQICGHDWRALRIEPPLTVSAADCEEFVAALAAELDWVASHE